MLDKPEQFGEYTSIAREGRVALVTFDRGDGLNALSVAAMKELIAVADSFEDDLDISAIVLTGTDKAFSAGADLKDPALDDRAGMGLLHRRHALKTGPKDRKSTRLNSSHDQISYAVFCLKKKKKIKDDGINPTARTGNQAMA